MVQNGQSAPTQHQLVQAPSGLWLPRQAQHTSQPHPVQTPNTLPTQSLPQKQTPSSIRQPWTEKTLAGKTYWEWMSLLLIPLLVGIGTVAVTLQQTIAQNEMSRQLHESDKSQQANDRSIAQQARYDDLLKAYRDGINALILDKNLRTSSLGSDVKSIAHSQTLDILRQVDKGRKGKVIAYLANLGLIQTLDQGKEPIMSLEGADLSGADIIGAFLIGADLDGAFLIGAHLSEARLDRASLIGADLEGAHLDGADLRGAHLSEANLSGANLSGANLSGANLDGANLDGANLSGAENITTNQLSQAQSLSGAIMPDGTKHPCKPEERDYCRTQLNKMTPISSITSASQAILEVQLSKEPALPAWV